MNSVSVTASPVAAGAGRTTALALISARPELIEVVRRTLAPRHDLSTIWVARDATEAAAAAAGQAASVVLLDLDTPGIDGATATRLLMRGTPTAVLLVGDDLGAVAAQVYDALAAGALGAVNAPLEQGTHTITGGAELLARIDLVLALSAQRDQERTSTQGAARPAPRQAAQQLIAIGASAGGPAALATLLHGLPEDFGASLVIVQHIDAHFTAGMAHWLNQQCPLPVRLIEDGDVAAPGQVLLAGSNHHVTFVDNQRLGYSGEAEDDIYCPSIDVFFRSVALRWQADAVGVLLTGMGRDGAAGLKALRDKGYHTIAQDSATSAVYGMPKAAVALNAAVEILPVDEIAAKLISIFNKPVKSALR